MSLLRKDLWSSIAKGATDIRQHLVLGLEVLGDSKVDEHDIGVLLLCPVEDVLWLDVSVHNVVVVQILDRREHCSDCSAGVALGEPASLEDPVKEFSAAGLFEDEVVL